jgi:hypothetical protein
VRLTDDEGATGLGEVTWAGEPVIGSDRLTVCDDGCPAHEDTAALAVSRIANPMRGDATVLRRSRA